MRLQISTRECGDVRILDLRGRATIGRESEFLSNQVRKLFANDTRKLLLNLVDLTQIDSSGVSIIAEAYVFLKRHGGGLKLLNPTARVLEVLSVLHLNDAIPSFDDETEALRAFSREPIPQRPKCWIS